MVDKQGADRGKQGGADDKFAAAAPSISLPKGGGAIRGIGEKLAANPMTGTGSMTVPIATSPGCSGFGPQLSLSYDSGSGNGPFGLGWQLSLPSITRKTDKGLPRYRDAEESDVFILSGAEDLVPVLAKKNEGTWERKTQPASTLYGPTYRIDRYRPRISAHIELKLKQTQVLNPVHSGRLCREEIAMGTEHTSIPVGGRTPAAGTSGECSGDNHNAGLGPLLPRVYITSETRLFREGIKAMLDRESGIDVIGHGSCSDALQEVGTFMPELVLLDMAGHTSLAFPRQLRAILPSVRIVGVAVAELEANVIACAEAGICGYVAQSGAVGDLVGAIICALNGELVCPPHITALLFGRLATLSTGRPASPVDGALTAREREIAGLVARGLQNKEIARRLYLGNATVKNHVHNILQKLKIQRRSEIFGRRFDMGPWLADGTPTPLGRLQRSA